MGTNVECLSGPKSNVKIAVIGGPFITKKVWFSTIESIVETAKKGKIDIKILAGEYEQNKRREFIVSFKQVSSLEIDNILMESGVRKTEGENYIIR